MNELNPPSISYRRILVPNVGLIVFRFPIQFAELPDAYTPDYFFTCYQPKPKRSPFFKEIFSKLCIKWAKINERPAYIKNEDGEYEEQDFLFNDQNAEKMAFNIETLVNVYYVYYGNKECALFKTTNHPADTPRN